MDLTAVHIFVLFSLAAGSPPVTLDLYERTFDTMSECHTYVVDHDQEIKNVATTAVHDFLQAMRAPPGKEPDEIAFGCRGKDNNTI